MDPRAIRSNVVALGPLIDSLGDGDHICSYCSASYAGVLPQNPNARRAGSRVKAKATILGEYKDCVSITVASSLSGFRRKFLTSTCVQTLYNICLLFS